MFRALMRRLRSSSEHSAKTVELLRQAVAGIANQSDLLNRKLEEVVAGIANQSDLINRKHEHLVDVIESARQPSGRRPVSGDAVARLSALLAKPGAESGGVAGSDRSAAEQPAAALADLCVAALPDGEDRVAFFDRLVA